MVVQTARRAKGTVRVENRFVLVPLATQMTAVGGSHKRSAGAADREGPAPRLPPT